MLPGNRHTNTQLHALSVDDRPAGTISGTGVIFFRMSSRENEKKKKTKTSKKKQPMREFSIYFYPLQPARIYCLERVPPPPVGKLTRVKEKRPTGRARLYRSNLLSRLSAWWKTNVPHHCLHGEKQTYVRVCVCVLIRVTHPQHLAYG